MAHFSSGVDTVVRCCRGPTQSRAAGLVGLLPLWKLIAEVQRHRQLRRGADGHTGQHQARTLRAQLGHSIHLRMVQEPRGLHTFWEREIRDCACTAVNDVGKPCAGEPHARFERGPLGRLTHVAGTAGLGSVRWKAITMAWSRPELQQWSAEPVAYLTAKGNICQKAQQFRPFGS